jgi:GNAT superfamily N-acetyltransferase
MTETETMLALFHREMRIEIEYPEARKEVLPGIVRFVRPAPGGNFLLYSSLPPEDLDHTIDEQIAYFRSFNQPWEWIVYEGDQPVHLRSRLEAHGMQCEQADVIMALDVKEAAGPLAEPVHTDVRRISSRAGLEDVVRVMEGVYGGNFSWMYERLGNHLNIPGYVSISVAYVESIPACAAWIYFYPNSHFAGLFGGSTLEEYRSKGLYTALLAARVQEAMQRGVHYLWLDASDMSRPIVRKYGFQPLTTSWSYTID